MGLRDLLKACEAYASKMGDVSIETGINLARTEAYREMLSNGFRAEFRGVAMQRPNEEVSIARMFSWLMTGGSMLGNSFGRASNVDLY